MATRKDESTPSSPGSAAGTEAAKAAHEFHDPRSGVPVHGAPLSASATKADAPPPQDKPVDPAPPAASATQYELNQAIPDPQDAERARKAMGEQPAQKNLSTDDRIKRIEDYLRAHGAPF